MEEKKGFFNKLFDGLSKTRKAVASSLENIFLMYNQLDEDFYEELLETLIMGDIGVKTSMAIIDELKVKVKEKGIQTPAECREELVSCIQKRMINDEHAYDFENQKSVLLIIGVNGVGKTTSAGKIASIYKARNKKVLLCAADTFRAGAIEQLKEWANRSAVDIIAQNEGADPSAVVFDACQAANARGTDILICDTAGRLHNKKNLMEELRKIDKILAKNLPEYKKEVLVVLDGTTGQNALEQARQFNEVADISGVILTKLDGTAKGGIAIAILDELGIPVKFIGVGEKIDDLQKFDAEDFANAIFKQEE